MITRKTLKEMNRALALVKRIRKECGTNDVSVDWALQSAGECIEEAHKAAHKEWCD